MDLHKIDKHPHLQWQMPGVGVQRKYPLTSKLPAGQQMYQSTGLQILFNQPVGQDRNALPGQGKGKQHR